MNATDNPQRRGSYDLGDMSARDLMTRDPVFLAAAATVDDAIRLLADRGISSIVVTDDSGTPLGVLTATDVLIHQRANLGATTNNSAVRDLMTPAIFSVRADAPARQVVEQLVTMSIHRVYVVDERDAIVGVVSPLEVLRKLG